MTNFRDFFWFVFLAGIIMFIIEYSFALPDVYWSESENRCVKVMYDGVESDCSELPEQYNRVWVR